MGFSQWGCCSYFSLVKGPYLREKTMENLAINRRELYDCLAYAGLGARPYQPIDPYGKGETNQPTTTMR